MLNDKIGFELDALEPIEDCYSSHPAPEEITNATFREDSFQRKESGKSSTLRWVFNNATRWDSDKRMMKRALILRPALNTFFNDVQSRWESESSSERIKPVALKYRLSPYDWKVVEILVKLLKPFEVATKQLQGTVYEEIEDPGTKERKRPPFSRGWTAKLGNHGRCSSNSGGKSYISITIFLPARFMWVQLSPILLRSGVFLICCGQESRPVRRRSWRQDYEHKLLQIWEQYEDREVD
ncbi:hypothetical protein MY8738_008558 [Beauveria namnaoensis]